MNTKAQPRLPEMLGALSHANQYLKAFSMATMAVAGLALSTLFFHLTRPPLVLTLAAGGEMLEKLSHAPKAEDQIRAAVRQYIEKRYQWEPANVKQRLAGAEVFVYPASLKAYQGAVAGIARFSTEKLVSQRIFPERMEVSLDKKTVLITGDRITSIQGLKAAGLLNLELSFENGPRTPENPWGLYITKEKELQ